MIKRIRYINFVLLFGFLLGISEGYITLWKDGTSSPAQIFPYRAKMLPESDRQALEDGIRIGTEIELQQLLEDYLS